MAEIRREKLKQALLLGFITLNVILILAMWADNLRDPAGNTGPGRSTQSSPTAPGADSTQPAGTVQPQTGTPGAFAGPVILAKAHLDFGEALALRPRLDQAFGGS